MGQSTRRYSSSHLLLAVAVALIAVAAPRDAGAQSVDTIVTWNRIVLAALNVPGANPPTVFTTRPLAIVSVAVFDAANSSTGPTTPTSRT